MKREIRIWSCEREDFIGVVSGDADDLHDGWGTEMAEFIPEERAKTVGFFGWQK